VVGRRPKNVVTSSLTARHEAISLGKRIAAASSNSRLEREHQFASHRMLFYVYSNYRWVLSKDVSQYLRQEA
jgi:hypothetical protein